MRWLSSGEAAVAPQGAGEIGAVMHAKENAHTCAAAGAAIAFVFATCLLALLFAGCGNADLLATTEQARESAQSAASSSASDDVADASASAAKVDEASLSSSSLLSTEAVHVTVAIDCSNAHAYNEKFPTDLGTFAVEIAPGQTVIDALEATGVDYAMRGSNYVYAIGGIEEKACGRDSGWLYLVDDEQPAKSADAFELSDGQSVRWVYTVTAGDVG